MLESPVPNPGARSSARFVGKPFAIILLALCSASMALAQNASQRARIVSAVDDSQTVKLSGNTHPLARAEFDRGAAPDTLAADRMLLLLSRSPEQQAALERLLQDQQTPGSPDFHKWLSPSDFARQFGPAASDLQQVTSWLQAQGFTVAHIGGGNTIVEFTGTAGQVRNAFHTQIHKYRVNGEDRWANATDPRIPSALAPVVSGVVSLNDFPRKPLSRQKGVYTRDSDGNITPAFTVTDSSGAHYYALAPADFATIYNTKPLLTAGNNGAGQTIAVLGQSNVHLQDVTDFRNMFGLGAGNTSVVIDGLDPGIVEGDETESLLDLEWSNAVAPGANIVLVSAQSTATTSGIDLAALHVLDNDMAGVMSLSYGACESQLGNAGNQFIQSIFRQAAAQGITVVVSSGDSGSAGCDDQNSEYVATAGLGVNGLASTPYNVAVGGTDFNDVGNQSIYWSSRNNSGTLDSALTYIPETTWNETCGAVATAGALNVCPLLPSSGTIPSVLNLWSGSGGASSCTTSTTSGSTVTCQAGTVKPAWQTGNGVPNDGVRDIPDVSLFAAGGSSSHSFYVLCEADAVSGPSCQPSSGFLNFIGVGGTSASAPSFAGIVALAEQKSGTRLGNINYQLYPLASGSGASCASTSSISTNGCIFNDIVNGNISVPCKAGTPNCSVTSGTTTGVIVTGSNAPAYMTTAGYDLATGLGSVNAANLVAAISRNVNGFTPTTASLTLNGATAAVSATHGSAISVGVALTPALAGLVALEGTNSAFDSNPLVAGSAVWNSTLFPGGSYTVKAHFPGDGQHGGSDSNGVPVTITPEASQTFLDLITFDVNTGNLTSYNGNNVPYGSPYILRMSVADTAATDTGAAGVSSKCSNKTASCPTGTVTVTANGQPLDLGSYKLNSLGVTEDLPIQLATGNFNLAASYSGDSSYNANTAAKSITIVKAPTTMTSSITSPMPPFQYGSVMWLGEVVNTNSNGAAPTGTFSITDNGAPATLLNSVPVNSIAGGGSSFAQFQNTSLYALTSLGSHSLVLQYSGDSLYQGSTSSAVTFNVVPYSPTYHIQASHTVSTTSIPVDISCDFYGSIYGVQPTGTITFYDNGTPIPGTVSYRSYPSGSLIITGNLNGITFSAGDHAITATYSGDTDYNSVTTVSPFSVMVYDKVPPVPVSLSANLATTVPNYSVQITAAFMSPDTSLPKPTGTISFYDNGQLLASPVTYSSLYYFTGTIPWSATAAGTHLITATYSGDANYAALTTQAFTLTVVDKFPSSISMGGQQFVRNQPVTLSASLVSSVYSAGPNMTGTVTFSEGGTPLPGTVQYNPGPGYMTAALPYTFTTTGTHTITAQYSGDSLYAGVTSSPASMTVIKELTLFLPSTTYAATGAGSNSSVLFVTNNTSSMVTVNFTCTPDSSVATCSLDQPSVSINNYNQVQIHATFNWPANSAQLQHNRPFGTMPFVFAGLFAGLAFTTRRKRALAIALLLSSMILVMASCGGGGGGGTIVTPPPPPTGNPVTTKTYNYTITATSGGVTDSQVFTVTVTK